MLHRVWNYAWSLRREFAKYFFVGISGVVLDLGTLVLFKKYLGLTAHWAVAVNQPIVLLYNFLLNKYWSFQNRTLSHVQVIRYLIVAAFNYGFSVEAMYLLTDRIHLGYIVARLLTIVVMVSWNFFLYKYWVYRTVHNPSGTLS